MTFDRSKFKGSDSLHLKFFRIESEFNALLRLYDLIDSEIKSESKRIEEISSDSLSFESIAEENCFCSLTETESDSFNEYFPQVSMKYAFIGMFGLFENYFKNLILILRLRIRFKGVTRKELQDQKIKDEYILEKKRIKEKINKTLLNDLKNEFICETKNPDIIFSSFKSMWFEFSKYVELRNAIIHNNSDVTKKVGVHWAKKEPKILYLEQFINEFFNKELYIQESKFYIKDKEILQKSMHLYLKLLDETKRIMINYTT